MIDSLAIPMFLKSPKTGYHRLACTPPGSLMPVIPTMNLGVGQHDARLRSAVAVPWSTHVRLTALRMDWTTYFSMLNFIFPSLPAIRPMALEFASGSCTQSAREQGCNPGTAATY